MTYTELITQAKQLPPDERILLVEAILRGLREEMVDSETEPDEKRRKRLQEIPPASAVRGVGKPDGRQFTDEELRNEYTEYLERKYA